jgi:hypothetical protein
VSDDLLKLLRGPVLFDPGYVTAQVPLDVSLATIDGREHLLDGSLHIIEPAPLGFADSLDVNAMVVTVTGWAVDALTNEAAAYVVTVHDGSVLQTVEYAPIERPDVSSRFGWTSRILAGFRGVYAKPLGYDRNRLRIIAVLTSGTAIELPWSHRP